MHSMLHNSTPDVRTPEESPGDKEVATLTLCLQTAVRQKMCLVLF